MDEQDSLIFLANVALHNQNDNPIIHRKRKDARPKELKIIHLNGSDIAEIDDLKSLPMSVLFKIFIVKYEDTGHQCTVYVCKFGVRNGCNTRFMDAKKNRIHRVEHLIQCHLLQHLIKTKSGSFIEIPKKSIENIKMIGLERTFSQNNNFKNIESRNVDSVQNVIHCENSYTEETLSSSIEGSRPNLFDASKSVAKLNTVNNNDHTYATTKKHTVNSSSTEVYPVKKSDNFKIDELFPPRIQRSDELSFFMLYEVLNQPVNIFIIDGGSLIVEKLSIVGAEVEISDSCDNPLPQNSVSSEEEVHYKCILCPSSYLTKKSLNLHVAKKHTDQQVKKPSKRKMTSQKETHSMSENEGDKKMRPLSASDDARNNRFVELKENVGVHDDLAVQNESSILKNALTKNAVVKRPIINISNMWNNINVQYV